MPVEEAFRRLRTLYWWSLGLATVWHLLLSLGLIFATKPHGALVPEPAKVKFFARRDPLLAKPLELRKVPQPKRQLVRPEVQVSAARMDQVRATAAFDARGLIASQGSGVGTFAPPRFSQPDRMGLGLEPATRAGMQEEVRVAENKIDLALEMLDVISMDTGRYRAMVIQDEGNRQNIKGFVKLASVVSVHTKNSIGALDLRLIGVLRDVLSSYTGLQAEFVGDFTYDDERILEVPIILFPPGYNRKLLPNEAEIKNLVQYISQGGFIIGPLNDDVQEGLEKYAGLVKGRDFWETRVPDDHPIFSSFFDIGGGVPSGSFPHKDKMSSREQHQVLHGWYLKGRLVAVQPSLGWGWENFRYQSEITRQLQMAVNVIIYALN